jgi:hypothetical protein
MAAPKIIHTVHGTCKKGSQPPSLFGGDLVLDPEKVALITIPS